jgi:hypothetical protein
MPAPLPFAVTAEVEAWLSQIPPRPDKQPGFRCSPRYGVFKGDDLEEEFEGEHYSIIHASSEAWLSLHAIQVVIATRAFWISPETLDKLRDKTLTVIEINASRKKHETKIRKFVVAA